MEGDDDVVHTSVLFAIVRLQGILPDEYTCDNPEHFAVFRAVLCNQEEQVLEALKKQFPVQKSTSVVELCSKVTWKIDPRARYFLTQHGQVKSYMSQYHPTEEEEAMIIQQWKSSWDSEVLC